MEYRIALQLESNIANGIAKYLFANGVPPATASRSTSSVSTPCVSVYVDSKGVRTRLPFPGTGFLVDASWMVSASILIETQRVQSEIEHNLLVGNIRYLMLDRVLAANEFLTELQPFELQRIEEESSSRAFDEERCIDSTEIVFSCAAILDLTQTTL